MSRDWRVYLEDVRDYSARVQRFTDGMTFEQFVADERTYHAVLHNLEVVGEAVKHLPEEVRNRAPEVPWRRIAGFRDRLAHAYFDIDPHIVWDAARNRVPSLHKAAVRILPDSAGCVSYLTTYILRAPSWRRSTYVTSSSTRTPEAARRSGRC